jgi:TatD DNase family protein
MLIDTHAHLTMSPLADDLSAVLARTKEQEVSKIIIPGTTIEDSTQALDLAAQEGVFGCIGMHPSDAHTFDAAAQATFEALLERGPVAIGEVGLDYFHTKEHMAEQKRVFTQMIGYAKQHDLPLIIHTRDAFADAHAMLKVLAFDQPFVIHCFTGTAEEAAAWLAFPKAMLSVTGIITYPKSEELRQVIHSVPLERLMIETDAPFLAPQGFRNRSCEPMDVTQVAKKLAEIKDIPLDEVARLTTANAEAFFHI